MMMMMIIITMDDSATLYNVIIRTMLYSYNRSHNVIFVDKTKNTCNHFKICYQKKWKLIKCDGFSHIPFSSFELF